MANIILESWKKYGRDTTLLAKYWDVVTGNSFVQYGGVYGGDHIRIGSSSTAQKIVSSISSGSVIYMGGRFKNTALGDAWMFYLVEGSAIHIGLYRTSAGYLTVRRGDGTTLWTSPTVAYDINVWYYFEVSLSVANSGGAYEVRKNGVSLGSGTGDTQNGGTGVAGKIYIGPGDFEDFYANDATGSYWNGFMGNIRIDYLPLSDPGDSSQWTPSYDQAYACLNNNDTTRYISTATANAIDLYGVSHVPAIVQDNILGINWSAVLWETPDGDGEVTPLIKDDGGTQLLTEITGLSTTEKGYAVMAARNYAGGQFTKAQVEAMQAGLKNTSG